MRVNSDVMNNSKPARTPGPWKWDGYATIRTDQTLIAAVRNFAPQNEPNNNSCEQDFANARYIVRACNAHDDLVAALRDASASLGACSDLLQAYPRPSGDPNGRILLDVIEHLTTAAQIARAVVKRHGDQS